MTSGWAARPSTRKATLPASWWRIRGHVLKRDGRRCQHVRYDTGSKCGEPANQVDHIEDRDDHTPANLQALCEWHHNQKSSSQGGAAAAARRRQNAKKEPRHPGLL